MTRGGPWLSYLRHDALVRAVVLIVGSVLIGLLVVDYGAGPAERLGVGDVAPRTVRAPRSFPFEDVAALEAQRVAAEQAVRPVFVHREDVIDEQRLAVMAAFRDAREDLLAAVTSEGRADGAASGGVDRLATETTDAVSSLFVQRLGVNVPRAVVRTLMRAGFPEEAGGAVVALLGEVQQRLILSNRDDLPSDRGPIVVVEAGVGQSTERLVRDLGTILEPEEARREIDMRAAVSRPDAGWAEAVTAVARAMVRPNLRYDASLTEERRLAASAGVLPVQVTVKRGTVLFRDGEELSADAVARYQALQAASGPATGLELVAVIFFIAVLVFALVHFGATNLRRFSLAPRDITAVTLLLVLAAMLSRIGVGLSEGVASVVGMGCEPRSVWFLVPFAFVPMLVRLLVGVNWAMVVGVINAAVAGLLMDLDGLMVLFVLVASVVGAGAVEHTRERMSVLRAGFIVGVAQGALALLAHLLSYTFGEGGAAIGMQLMWSMLFAGLGGLLASFIVLALMPMFERMGFVTDYRLMELANLNHPLMKQLMLRAPGSYHHSVVVGSLAEAACERVGANALQTRVAAYFHDIGKAVKPQYYVENQGSQSNRHAGLDPHTSAAIIISHVTDGADLARKHRLPKPCIDNIYMHHGTGLLQYFYARAVDEAGGRPVDEKDFRYPGPKPDSRESGILMLADKVEAATRTIQEPTEDKFRSMIHAIINSVMADDQFASCPLTFQDLYQITDAFVGVLLGIHHQRIEYPQTAHLSVGRKDVPPPPRRQNIITLEIPAQDAARSSIPSVEDEPPDYEAVEYLPGTGS